MYMNLVANNDTSPSGFWHNFFIHCFQIKHKTYVVSGAFIRSPTQ